MNTFEKVDNALARDKLDDGRNAAMELLALGATEGTFTDVVQTIADSYKLKPVEIVVWYSKVLKCRALHYLELLQKMAELAVPGEPG